MKSYKLLKDLPDVKAGAVFTWNGQSGEYVEERFSDEINRDCNFGTAYHFCANTIQDKTWFSPITNTLEEIIEEEFRFPQGDMMLSDNNYQIFNSEAKARATKAAKSYASSILKSAIEIIEKLKNKPTVQFTEYHVVDKAISELTSILKESEQ